MRLGLGDISGAGLMASERVAPSLVEFQTESGREPEVSTQWVMILSLPTSKN